MTLRRLLTLASIVFACSAFAQSTEPRVAVVLLQGKGLAGKEVETLLDAANDEVKSLSAYRLDPASSLEADNEASMNQCTLDYDCLLRVAQAVGVDAVMGIRATPEGRKTLTLEFLWVSTDAKGLPGESDRAVNRTPQALETGVRNSLKKVLPGYARKDHGGITVLAEPGSRVIVDGEPKGESPLSGPVVVSAGVHRVDVLTPTNERVTMTVDVPEGRKVIADLPSPHPVVQAMTHTDQPTRGSSLKIASYAVGGAALVALGVGVFFGAQTLSTNGQLREGACAASPCSGGLTQVQAQELYNRASGSATGANIGVTTGALLGLGAGALFYLGTRDEPPAAKSVDVVDDAAGAAR